MDSDDDYDENYLQNETPPPALSEDFIKSILDIKNKLYNNIVLSPNLGTPNAQDTRILQTYLDRVNDVYILSINAQNGKLQNMNLDKFPENVRELIQKTLESISAIFSKNTVADTIPYRHFIDMNLHYYPFKQNYTHE